MPDFKTTFTTAPLVRPYSAARPLSTTLNSETVSGEGFTTTFSAPSAALRLPSRYHAFAPPWPPLALMLDPTKCCESGNPPNWLSNPKRLPEGPLDCVTPGMSWTSVWMSRPCNGMSWI